MNKRIYAWLGVALLTVSACSSSGSGPDASSAQTAAPAGKSGACRFVGAEGGKGKNDAYLCSAQAALNSSEAAEVLDSNIRVGYGSVGGNTLTSRQVANAVGKSPEETCQRAFLSAVKRFQSTAARRNAKSVRVTSYFNKKTLTGGEYECHIGTWNSRVVLKGSFS